MKGYKNLRKQTKTPIGALTIVGRDKNHRTMVLPTSVEMQATETANNRTNIKKEKRSFFNVFIKKMTHIFDKNKHKSQLKKRFSKLTATECNGMTFDYMTNVNKHLTPLHFYPKTEQK